MKYKSRKAISKIIYVIFVLLIMALLFGFLARYSDGFTKDFQTFYIKQNDRLILGSAQEIELSPNEPARFEPCYTFGFSQIVEKRDYTIKIIPNPKLKTPIDFYIDSVPYLFQAEKDLTPAFEIVKEKGYFTVSAPNGLLGVLKELYPQKSVTLDYLQVPDNADLFCMLVTTFDESAIVQIYFRIHLAAEQIELNPGSVIF